VSIRRELLDHAIVLHGDHLRWFVQVYARYHNAQRIHPGINKDSPEPREIHVNGEIDKVAVENETLRPEMVRTTLFVFRKISSAIFMIAQNNALNS
jgi:hypothetical protein